MGQGAGWLCWDSESWRSCITQSYRLRIAELQARFQLIPESAAVRYECNSNSSNEVVATFFKTDPPTLIAEFETGVSIMFLQPSGSGARYQRHNTSLWEHHGEALISCILFNGSVLVQAAGIMTAFPAAEKGMVRFCLQLPQQLNEMVLKVELIVGRAVRVDGENRFFFPGKIEAQTIDGWGYTGYMVDELGPLAGTLMAVDPNAPKVDRFLS